MSLRNFCSLALSGEFFLFEDVVVFWEDKQQNSHKSFGLTENKMMTSNTVTFASVHHLKV